MVGVLCYMVRVLGYMVRLFDYMVGCWVTWWHVMLHGRVLGCMVECWVTLCNVGLYGVGVGLHGGNVGFHNGMLGYMVGSYGCMVGCWVTWSFFLGNLDIEIVDKYKYLGIFLDEFLDFKCTASIFLVWLVELWVVSFQNLYHLKM